MNSENMEHIYDSIVEYLFKYYNVGRINANHAHHTYIKMTESISSSEKKRRLRELDIDILSSDSTSDLLNLRMEKERITHLNINDNVIDSTSHNFIESKDFSKKLDCVDIREMLSVNQFDNNNISNIIIKILIENINRTLLNNTVGIEEMEIDNISELKYYMNLYDISNRGYQISGILSDNLKLLINNIYGNFDIGYNRLLISPNREGIIFKHGGIQLFSDVNQYRGDIVNLLYRGFVGILSPERSKIININMNDRFFE